MIWALCCGTVLVFYGDKNWSKQLCSSWGRFALFSFVLIIFLFWTLMLRVKLQSQICLFSLLSYSLSFLSVPLCLFLGVNNRYSICEPCAQGIMHLRVLSVQFPGSHKLIKSRQELQKKKVLSFSHPPPLLFFSTGK